MNKKRIEIVMAILVLVTQVLVFALGKRTGYIVKKTSGFFNNFTSILKKSSETLVYVMSVLRLILELGIEEIFCTIFELFDVDQMAIINYLTRRPAPEPSRSEIVEQMARAAEIRKTERVQSSDSNNIVIINRNNTSQVRIYIITIPIVCEVMTVSIFELSFINIRIRDSLKSRTVTVHIFYNFLRFLMVLCGNYLIY